MSFTQLPSSTTPMRFVEALKSTIAPWVSAVASGDGRLSKTDARRALKAGGRSLFLKDALEDVAKNGAVDVREFIEAQIEVARAAAEKASGDDGRLSRADADNLPTDLRLAFRALKAPGDLLDRVPTSWRGALDGHEVTLAALDAFVTEERTHKEIFPPRAEVFKALEKTPLDDVKVVLVGQDPYHGDGQAHGLSFSVPDGVKQPPSLKNILKELASDTGTSAPTSGNLEAWAERGVLLLNTALTVEKKKPASHANKGWEEVTEALLRAVNDGDRSVVFVLLGAHAQKLGERLGIDETKHAVVARSHPSPYSVRANFEGTKPFTAVNDALAKLGLARIDWTL